MTISNGLKRRDRSYKRVSMYIQVQCDSDVTNNSICVSRLVNWVFLSIYINTSRSQLRCCNSDLPIQVIRLA
jgi:hypothetical protein